jgi:hypothetical protein
VDVLAVLRAFEEMNECSIVVRLFAQSTAKLSVLQVVVEAWGRENSAAEPVLLGSRQLTLGYHNPQTMESVILQALYGLDGDMAREEYAKIKR